MDQNETVQLNLDEEQLQDVTGGCETCRSADNSIKMHESWIPTHTDNMIQSIKAGDYADAAISARYRQHHVDGVNSATAIKEEAKRTNPGPHS